MDPEAKGDQRGDWAAETTSGARLKPPKQTLTLSKSEVRWIQAMLQSEHKENQEPVDNTVGPNAAAHPCKLPGGRHRSIDHPNWTDEGYKTMSTDELERRAARWGHISMEQMEASRRARQQPGSPPTPGQADISTSQ